MSSNATTRDGRKIQVLKEKFPENMTIQSLSPHPHADRKPGKKNISGPLQQNCVAAFSRNNRSGWGPEKKLKQQPKNGSIQLLWCDPSLLKAHNPKLM